ncbi:MAG: threonylcarbamoyl-AMP synthase, partial [Planctomycetaceae bacterium]|nr:threonylcarbamoyl-AMP synthase [Planctomycetaceae bacterium]
MTLVLPPTPDSLDQAAELLRRGRLVAFPTETVYGLGAAAENSSAVKALFAAKGRPADHPVIVHLADASQLADWAVDVPPAARHLAAVFWPGPLTLVLCRGPRVSDLVTGGLDTVGLRVPGHPVAQQLLRRFGSGIAAPSANRFGRVSPTTAQHVLAELDERVDLVLDGGPCAVGLESTIVDLSREKPAVLRPGGITAQQLAAVIGQVSPSQSADAPRVSGSLESHYAPQARIELLSPGQIAARAAELSAQGKKVAVLLRESASLSLPPHVMVISLPADDVELAKTLYATLRRVDELGCDVALTTLPIEQGMGVAIADRLRKAAGPRAG